MNKNTLIIIIIIAIIAIIGAAVLVFSMNDDNGLNDLFVDLKSWETDKIFVVRLPQRRQIIYYMPFISETSSNIGIIYDLHTKTWLRRKVPQEVSIAFEYDNNVYISTADGKVLREFYDEFDEVEKDELTTTAEKTEKTEKTD